LTDEKGVKDCEERLQQLQSERHRQAMLFDKAGKDEESRVTG